MAANVFVGVNNVQGVTDSLPTIAATTQSKDVEINILTANVPDRETCLIALDKLIVAITNGTWPLI